jgi:hypothetical protein
VIVRGRLDEGPVVSLGRLPDRPPSTREAFLRSSPLALRVTLPRAGVDRSENDRQALQPVWPQVPVVGDRFPVARRYRDAVDAGRITEMKRLKTSLPTAEDATLKSCRRAFWNNRAALTAAQQAALARWFRSTPALRLV